MRILLGELDLLTYYGLFNLVVTLCSIIIIANLRGKQIKSIQLYLAIFLAFFATFLIWYANGCYHGLLAFLVVFSAQLPLT